MAKRNSPAAARPSREELTKRPSKRSDDARFTTKRTFGSIREHAKDEPEFDEGNKRGKKP